LDKKKTTLTYGEVFEYPPETDNIFRLFLLAVTGITIIIGNYIPSFLFETESSPLSIIPLTEFYDVDKVFSTSPDEFYRNALLFIKPIAIQFSFVIFIFGLSYFIYRRKPAKIIRQNNLTLISDTEVLETLNALKKKSGLTLNLNYYVNGNIKDFSAQVFGAGNKIYLKAGRGLVKIMLKKNYDMFENIILHEYSHIKNKDIGKTYFAESFLKTPFLITLITASAVMFYALIKNITGRIISNDFTVLSLMGKISVYLNLFLQVAVLLILLFVIFRMLIRSREYYADLRAASLKSADTMISYFKKAGEKVTAQNLFEKLSGFHPSLNLRYETLADPVKIFRPSEKLLFINTLVSYIFFAGAFIYGLSLLLMIFTVTGYSMLFLLKGFLNEYVHLMLVYIELLFGTIFMALFLLFCGSLMRKSFFFQIDKIHIFNKYAENKISVLPAIIRLSLTASLGIVCGYMLLPLYGFNVLHFKNLLSVPFVFVITFVGFFVINYFHYFWMDSKINNEYKVDYSVPVLLGLFEGILIVIIFLTAILSFQFFTTLLFV